MNNKIIDDHISKFEAVLAAVPKTTQRFAIVYHGDCDGVVSAALLGFLLKKTSATARVTFIPVRTEQFDFLEALDQLDNINPDFTFFLDLSIQDYPEKFQFAVSATKNLTIVYDHHSQTQTTVPQNVLYLNPSITPNGFDNESPPPCFFAAKLCQKVLGQDFDWVAGIGLIAESSVEHFLPLFQELPKKFPDLFGSRSVYTPDDVQNSKLKDITYSLGAAFWGPVGEFEHLALDALSRMIQENSPNIFFNASFQPAQTLIELETEIRNEIDRLTKLSEQYAFRPTGLPLCYVELTSIFRVGGVVATRLSHAFKQDIIITGQYFNNRFVIEARRGGSQKTDVSLLLRETVKGLQPINVGGHPFAAGASLPSESRIQFFYSLVATISSFCTAYYIAPSFSWKTVRYLEESNNLNHIYSGIRWLLWKQNRDGSWGRKSELAKIIATHQVVATLLANGFGFRHLSVAKATKWLSDEKRTHHHKFWRTGALSGIPGFEKVVVDDFQSIETVIKGGASPHLRHVMELFMLKMPEILPEETDKAESYVSAVLNQFGGSDRGWREHPTPTAHAISLLERYSFVEKSKTLYEGRRYTVNSCKADGEYFNWDNKVVATGYIIINLSEAIDPWKDPELTAKCIKASLWLTSRQTKQGYWAVENPLYGGGEDVMTREYVTAVAIRALSAISHLREEGFSYQLARMFERLQRKRFISNLITFGILLFIGLGTLLLFLFPGLASSIAAVLFFGFALIGAIRHLLDLKDRFS